MALKAGFCITLNATKIIRQNIKDSMCFPVKHTQLRVADDSGNMGKGKIASIGIFSSGPAIEHRSKFIFTNERRSFNGYDHCSIKCPV